jgi:hypothetical protein
MWRRRRSEPFRRRATASGAIPQVHDRIDWLEQVFMAAKRAALRRQQVLLEQSNLSRDEMVLSINWEAATVQRNSRFHCAAKVPYDHNKRLPIGSELSVVVLRWIGP